MMKAAYKRLCKIALCMTLVFLCAMPAYAKNGDIAGFYYYTDIKTLFYFSPVTSYNIGGKTVIDAEALNWHFGFDVYWHAVTRTLDILDKGGMFNSYQAMNGELCTNTAGVPGEIAGHYYKTDIVTIFNGKKIDSYNIGGRTCVVAEELNNCGYTVTWDAAGRTLTIKKPPDFYSIQTDYGAIKTIYSSEQPAGYWCPELYHRGILLTDKDGTVSELATPSDTILSGYGSSSVRLSDVCGALGAACSLKETLETDRYTDSFNGFSYDMTQYKYCIELTFDQNAVRTLKPAQSSYPSEAFSTDKYHIISDISIAINGAETPFGILVIDGEVYIDTDMVAEMLGYASAR